MAESVRTADLQRLLAVIDAARTVHAADGLPTDVLEQARDLVPCDGVALGEFDPTRQRVYLDQAEPADEVELDPGIFWHHYWDSAHCSYPDRSGDLLSVTTISEFYTRRQWRNTGMYADYFSKLGIQAEAMLCLSAPPLALAGWSSTEARVLTSTPAIGSCSLCSALTSTRPTNTSPAAATPCPT